MEAAQTKELSGEKAQRIIEAMRSSVARRGISGSTFEHVAREAGVSRGLLHYYFGTKEALLVEVVRRDSEHRIARLDEPLGKATSADEILQVLVASLQDSITNEPGFWVLIFELFTAGRRNPEIEREIGELFARTRDHVADILRAKEREGVLVPRLRRRRDRRLPVRRRRRPRPADALRPRSRPHRDDRGRERQRRAPCSPDQRT